MAGFKVPRARFPAAIARAASVAALVLAAGSALADPASPAPGQPLALFDPTEPAALGSRGCAEIALAAPGDWLAVGAAPLACGGIIPPRPREFDFSRGEASWKLGLGGGDARSIGQVRGAFDLDHGLKLGPLGAWQLRGEVALVRPSGEASFVPLREETRLTLSRGLAGWNLRFEGSAASSGALNPLAALSRQTELSANLSRGFRLSPFGTEHQIAFRLAESSTLDLPSGVAGKLLLAGIDYSHALAKGSLSATLAWSHAAPQGAAASSSGRALLRYSLSF